MNECLARATHACVIYSFSKGEKRGIQYQYKMDSVLRNYFAGGRIRKTETNVFKIRRDLSFRPAGGCGRNAGRGFLDFASLGVN